MNTDTPTAPPSLTPADDTPTACGTDPAAAWFRANHSRHVDERRAGASRRTRHHVSYPPNLVPELLWIQKESRDMALAGTRLGSIRREQWRARAHAFSLAFDRVIEGQS